MKTAGTRPARPAGNPRLASAIASIMACTTPEAGGVIQPHTSGVPTNGDECQEYLWQPQCQDAMRPLSKMQCKHHVMSTSGQTCTSPFTLSIPMLTMWSLALTQFSVKNVHDCHAEEVPAGRSQSLRALAYDNGGECHCMTSMGLSMGLSTSMNLSSR